MIASWASNYVGLPYEESSWGPDKFDCWGLIAHIYKKEFDIDLCEEMQLSMYEDKSERIVKINEHISEWDKVYNPEPSDGMLFLIGHKLPHCGLYIGEGRMIHSINHVSSCIQRINNIKWNSRLEGYYRYRQNIS